MVKWNTVDVLLLTSGDASWIGKMKGHPQHPIRSQVVPLVQRQIERMPTSSKTRVVWTNITYVYSYLDESCTHRMYRITNVHMRLPVLFLGQGTEAVFPFLSSGALRVPLGASYSAAEAVDPFV